MKAGLKAPTRHFLAFALTFLAVATLYLGGALRFVDNEMLEARFALFERNATSDLVIVAIDPASLEELGTWPWPRSYHAEVAERLAEAGAERIAFDIDFSLASTPESDSRFEEALERTGSRVILPVFKQRSGAGKAEMMRTEPLPAFRERTSLASVAVRPDRDGVVRRMSTRERWGDGWIPHLPARLAGLSGGQVDSFYLDFGIEPATVPVISFADILTNRFDRERIAGKSVIIGATAVELGDYLTVPHRGVLPGVQVLALAYQSLVQDRALQRVNPLFVLVIVFLVAAAFGAGCAHWGWRKSLVVLALIAGAVVAVTMAAHHEGFILDGTAILLTATLCFVSGIIDRSQWQALRLLSQGREIRKKETMMKGVVDNSFDAIFILDDGGLIENANPAAGQLFGCDAAALVGRHIGDLVPRAASLIARGGGQTPAVSGARCHEMTAHRQDRSSFPVELAMRRMSTENGSWQIAFVRDITERKAHQDALQHQALHDSLTELPNRAYLYKRLEESIRRSAQKGERFALLLTDLDHFKEVNDTLGHHIGDILLRQIARRLAKPLRKTDMIARLGGDEFAIVFSPAVDRASVSAIAERLRQALETPLTCKGLALDIGASVGISLYPDDGTDATELVQKADVAMYLAKNSGASMAFYDPEKDHHSVRHLTLSGELKRAIEEQALELYYQPKVCVATNRVIGVESLARWNHPTHGFVPPDEFIALAEQTGLIGSLTEWALTTAIQRCAGWRAAGLDLTVAVNLSAKTLHDRNLPKLIGKLLEKYDVGPEYLILEITESAIMADPERAKDVIDLLHQKGLRLSIDDFGTGYSSLGYLKKLPVQELKIDKSFVMEMMDNVSDQVIVKSTIDLAHNLGLKVVAEGVETPEVLGRLGELGSDVAQGYFISRPIPASDFEEWLRARTDDTAKPRLVVVAGGAT